MKRLALISFVTAAAALAACQQQEPTNTDNPANEPVLNFPSVPRPQPPQNRADLLQAVAQAASATAAGTDMPQSVRSLDGRQFELRIRFGCRGPTQELQERWLGWSYDAENRRIRVRAMPTISKEEPIVANMAGDQFEAVEGFWIPRPWLHQAVCPAAAAVSSDPARPQQNQPASGGAQRDEQPTENGQTAEKPDEGSSAEELNSEPVPTWPRVGIAQYFTEQDPRTRRRDSRAYQAGHTLAQGKALGSQGFNLVLSGRLRALRDRGVIQCSAPNADSPPECLISAEFLRVWIEQPETKEIIAEWGSG